MSSLCHRSRSSRPSSRSIRTVSSRKSGLPPALAISVSANGVSAMPRRRRGRPAEPLPAPVRVLQVDGAPVPFCRGSRARIPDSGRVVE